jgi:hypothetical protein
MTELFDCTCNQQVKHKGKFNAPGSTIQLTQADIDLVGDAVTVNGPADGHPDNPAVQQAEQLNALTLAIAKIDKKDKSAWIAGGKPSVDALQDHVDFDVTARLREMAWTLFNEEGNEESGEEGGE